MLVVVGCGWCGDRRAMVVGPCEDAACAASEARANAREDARDADGDPWGDPPAPPDWP